MRALFTTHLQKGRGGGLWAGKKSRRYSEMHKHREKKQYLDRSSGQPSRKSRRTRWAWGKKRTDNLWTDGQAHPAALPMPPADPTYLGAEA